MDHDESNLLAQLATDVDRSFEKLMLNYWPQLYAFVLRRIASPQDAEDIVLEAFARAYIALRGYPPERIRTLKLRAWLTTITYHEYCRFLGQSMHASAPLAPGEEGAAIAQLEDHSERPEQSFERAERRQELENLIATLPAHHREAVRLYFFEELSYQEIADLLAQPLGTVKSHVHRGIQLLRNTLHGRSNEVY